MLCLAICTATLCADDDQSRHYYPPEELQERPTVKFFAQPSYPYALAKKGISGSVTLEIVVNPYGKVIEATVVEATQPEFGEAAKKAIFHTQFRPGKINGKPVFVRLLMPLSFDVHK